MIELLKLIPELIISLFCFLKASSKEMQGPAALTKKRLLIFLGIFFIGLALLEGLTTIFPKS